MASESAVQTSDFYATFMVTPPSIHWGACRICRGSPKPGFAICWKCSNLSSGLNNLLADVVVPISLAVPGSSQVPGLGQFVHVLYDYKDPASNQQLAKNFRWGLTAVLWRFFKQHGDCIKNIIGISAFNCVTIVPSTSNRVGIHPLEEIVSKVFPSKYVRALEVTEQTIDRRDASLERFQLISDVRDKSVLLIDDAWTTGAKAQSAAGSLKQAGAGKVAIVVLGRILNAGPGEGPTGRPNRHLVDEARSKRPFTWEKCCFDWDAAEV